MTEATITALCAGVTALIVLWMFLIRIKGGSFSILYSIWTIRRQKRLVDRYQSFKAEIEDELKE
jgi:hypothetical protein